MNAIDHLLAGFCWILHRLRFEYVLIPVPGGPYNRRFGKSAPDNDSFSTATTSFCSTTSSTLFGRLKSHNHSLAHYSIQELMKSQAKNTYYFSTHGCDTFWFLATLESVDLPASILPVFKNACIFLTKLLSLQPQSKTIVMKEFTYIWRYFCIQFWQFNL